VKASLQAAGSARIDGSSDAWFGALLFVLALAARLAVALAFASEAVWDGHYYDFGARRIAAGLGYSDDRSVGGQLVWHPWCHYPVGYSAFLAVFYRFLGASPVVASVANALVGAALAVVTWALGREALSTGRARMAGLIVALDPGLVLYAALVMSEPLAALLTFTSFWLVVRFRSRSGFASGAAVLGVAALVRPQALLCAPFLGLAFKAARHRLVGALAACVVALAVVLPWSARNCRVMDGCALVSTNAGWNLAIGAFPRATGRFETLRSSDGCRDVTGQVQQDRCWLQYGLEQIRERPLRWLSLVPTKLGFTFDHESFAVEYLHEARPELWPEPLRSRARGLTTLAHRLLLAAAALGGVAFPLQRSRPGATVQGALLVTAALLGALAFTGSSPSFWPLAVFAATIGWLALPGGPRSSPALQMGLSLLGTTIVAHAVFFGEDRYHIVVTPVLALLAAAALRGPRATGPGYRAVEVGG
jgi:hypothetical protein